MASPDVDMELIESLPPSLLHELPAGKPPPGVESNFENPQSRVPITFGIGIPFFPLAVFCLFIRLYTKLAITKNWKWDDLTCSLGFIFALVYFAAVIIGGVHGALGRHMWDLSLADVLSDASTFQACVTTIMTTPALGLIKGTLFIQYYQIFRPLRWLRICVWIGATISSLFYIAVSITAFVMVTPWPGESFQDLVVSDHMFTFSDFSIPTGVVGMLVDWYLLILPISAVFTLEMSMAKKLGVVVVFMTGGIAAVASIISLYYRVRLEMDFADPLWDGSFVLLGAMVEMFAGVAASSMPTVSQFFTLKAPMFASQAGALKSSLASLFSSSSQEKSRAKSEVTGLSHSTIQASWESKGYRIGDIESAHPKAEDSRHSNLPHSRILLTKDVVISEEEKNRNRARQALSETTG